MGSIADDPHRQGLTAKRFGRRGLLATLGAALATAAVPAGLAGGQPDATRALPVPAAAPRGPLRPLAFPTTPRAFSRDEITTLGHLVETILPATDTPGAREAGVHWFLDDVASHEPETRTRLASGLALADALARARFEAPYAAVSVAEQDEVMVALAAGGADEQAFYRWLRTRVIDAYYKSEMGLFGELHWTGHEFHVDFPGRCSHDDPLAHPRAGWPSPGTHGHEA